MAQIRRDGVVDITGSGGLWARGRPPGPSGRHWGREPRIGVGGLPAPMTCCLLRWGRRPSCPVLGAGPCPRSCWLAAPHVGDGLHRLVRVGCYRAILPRGSWLAAPHVGDGLHRLVRVGCYRAILPRGSCASSFASDAAVSKGSLGPGEGTGAVLREQRAGSAARCRPWGEYGGSFASEVEFSKGYRHFASVITLAKCGIAVKAEASL